MFYRNSPQIKEKLFTPYWIAIASFCILGLTLLSCSGEDESQDETNLYDGQYEGLFYYEGEQLGSWTIEIEDGRISPVSTSASDEVLISGVIGKDGLISGTSEIGYEISGVIEGEEIHGTWVLDSYSGSFSGYRISSSTDDENEEDEEDDGEGEEEEEEEEEEENDYSELDADFSLVVEGPLGTTGGYWDDPVSIEFGTSNDHYQNYSPSPEFSWSYYMTPVNKSEEELKDLSNTNFTEFSDKVTYTGYSFTREVQLKPAFDTTFVYFRLAITKPNGDVVVKTKKTAFPMIRATGYFKVDGTTYPLNPEDLDDLPFYASDRITFKNINNNREEIPYFSTIKIPETNKTVGDYLYIEISTALPAGQLLSFYQMANHPTCYTGCYEKLGFYVTYGNYSTFDDPNGQYSKGRLNVVQSNAHPDIQGAIELEMTLRGNHGSDEEDEITAELVLFNVTAEDYD